MSEILDLSVLPVLETERLVLRKVEAGDIEDIFRYTNDPVFYETMGRPSPFSAERTRAWVESFVDKPGIWVMVRKADDMVIGDCGFCQVHEQAGRGEVSYALGQAYWNRGYATEAAKRVIQFGFEELGFNRIQAICNVANAASERVLQKAGLQYEGTLRHYIHHEGIPLDMKMYAVLKEDFE